MAEALAVTMHLGWSKTRVSPIAVDCGADSLKLLQIVPGEPPELLAAASVEMPEEARTDLAMRTALLPEAIQELLSGHRFRGRRAICSIPAWHTLVQNFQIPSGDDVDVDGQVGLQLRQQLNVDPSRLVVRTLLAPGSTAGSRRPAVCLAASRDVVMRCIQIASRARLDVVGMHCEPLALVQAFRHLYRRQDDANRTTAFIDIGAATTKLVITHGTAVVVAKVIHVGGDHFIRQVARAQGLSFVAARASRIQAGGVLAAPVRVPVGEPTPAREAADRGADCGAVAMVAEDRRSGVDPFLATGSATAVDTAAAAGPHAAPERAEAGGSAAAEGEALECLVDELKLCLRYHQQVFAERPVEKLVFLGGESHQGPLCQQVARALGIDARRGDPLARLRRAAGQVGPSGVDLRQAQPGWAVAVGLCLSETNL